VLWPTKPDTATPTIAKTECGNIDNGQELLVTTSDNANNGKKMFAFPNRNSLTSKPTVRQHPIAVRQNNFYTLPASHSFE